MKNLLHFLTSTGFFLLSSAPASRPWLDAAGPHPATGALRPLRVARSSRSRPRPRIQLATGLWSA